MLSRFAPFAGLMLAAAALLPAPAHAADLTLAPAGDWALREYDDKCRITRVFGSGEDAVTLWIDQGSLAPTFNVTLLGRPLRHPYGQNISVQFAPEPEYFRNYLYAESSKGRPVVTLFGVRLTPNAAERALLGLPEAPPPASASAIAPIIDPGEAAIALAAGVTDIRFGRALMKPVSLASGPLDQPLAQLQDCAAQLERRLGVNTAFATTPARPLDQEVWWPEVEKGYPTYLAMANEEAVLDMKLTIAANGRATYCEVQEVEGLTSFNDTACLMLLKHGRFEPARSPAGEALVSRYRMRISFTLED